MKRSRHNRGMALLVVLVVVALLTTLLTEMAFSTLVDLRLTETFRDNTRAYYLAKGGINVGRKILQEDKNNYDGFNELWSQGVSSYPVDDGFVSIRITDHDGKLGINSLVQSGKVNALMVDRFYRLFDSLELDKLADPAELTAALIDWLDVNDTPYAAILTDGEEIPVAGAEKAYYQGLTPPYPVKNGKLETLDELTVIKGFSPEVLRIILPHIDLHDGESVNINTASAEVLLSLGQGIYAEAVETLLEYRSQEPVVVLDQLEDVLDAEAYSLLKSLGNMQLAGTQSSRYRIEAEAAVNDGRHRLLAEVDKNNEQLLFFKVN